MNWLILVAIAVLFDSARIYIDNYISDFYFKGREAVSQKLFFGYAFVVVSILLAVIFGIDFSVAPASTFWLLFLAGVLSSVAGIPYYRTLELDNSTNLGIFIQTAPILYLVLGWLFLGETISPSQLVAFLIILAAPITIILTTQKRSRKVKLRAVFYAFLYVLISVSGNLIFVKENASDLSFPIEMSLLFMGKGVGNLIIMAVCRKWTRRFKNVYHSSHKKVLKPLFSTLSFSLVKDFAYRSALVLAPSVAIASATSDSTEPIVIFFMGIILTLIWPNFGREKLNRKNVIVHLAATVLVVIGIIILQF